MRRALIFIVGAGIAAAVYQSWRSDIPVALTTEAVTRGSIVVAVSSTGTLQAVTTVQVGSQVSGTIASLGADFNQLVKKGDVLAKLDQSVYVSDLDEARAALVSAESDAQGLRVAHAEADMALGRARELAAEQLLPAADLQTAETDSGSSAAEVVGADAKVEQARAAVKSAEVDLSKTVILSPIDGVVIARNIDVGQTVSASLSAPTLFIIAADLTKLQVDANIDESDLGHVAPNQAVTFRVDAYPSDTFHGTVTQVRLDPTTLQNVVTYDTIIDAPNPELKLKPGMTANVTIEVARRDNVLRVPASALRFKPDAAVLAHFGLKGVTMGGKVSTVWVSEGTTITPVTVTTGATDGTQTEILNAPFAEGTRIVTRATSSASGATIVSTATGNPLLPTRPPGR